MDHLSCPFCLKVFPSLDSLKVHERDIHGNESITGIDEENKIDEMEEQYENVQKEMELLKKKIDEEKKNLAIRKAELIEEERKKLLKKKAEDKMKLLKEKIDAQKNVSNQSSSNLHDSNDVVQPAVGSSFESVLKNLLNVQSQTLQNRKMDLGKVRPIKEEPSSLKLEHKDIKVEPISSNIDSSKNWILGDKTVPKNWKICKEVFSVGGIKKKKISFLSPNGQHFNSRRKAVEYMMKNKWDKNDIDLMSAIWLKAIKGVTQINEPRKPFDIMSTQINNLPRKQVDFDGTQSDNQSLSQKLIDFNSTQVNKQTLSQGKIEVDSTQINNHTLSLKLNDFNSTQINNQNLSQEKIDFTQIYNQTLKQIEPPATLSNKQPQGQIQSKSTQINDQSQLVKESKVRDGNQWIVGDSSVPRDWKYCKKNYVSSNGYVQMLEYFCSPKGQTFNSRTEALNFMIERQCVTHKDILLMRRVLKENEKITSKNWILGDDSVPSNWKICKEYSTSMGQTRSYFASPSWQFFYTRRLAAEFMIKHNQPEKDIVLMNSHLEKGIKGISKMDLKFRNMKWIEEDKSVPKGWKISKVESHNSGSKIVRTYLCSPDGQYFNSRREAVEFMNRNQFDNADIQLMKKDPRGCEKTNQRFLNKNWVEGDRTVPSGWKICREDANFGNVKGKRSFFASPDEQFFNSRRLVVEFMLANKYDQKDIELVNFYLERGVNGVSKDNHRIKSKFDKETMLQQQLESKNWISNDVTVPAGWKIAREDSFIGSKPIVRSYFCSPEGQYFPSRRQACDFMTKNYYPQNQIELMSKHLDSPKLDNQTKLQQQLGSKNWFLNDETVPIGWKIAKEDAFIGNKPIVRSYFCSPDGKYFPSRRQAYEFMTANYYPLNEIEIMRKSLERRERKNTSVPMEKKTWTENEKSLPQGWKVCQEDLYVNGTKKTRTYFASPNGQYFNSDRMAVDFMKANGYDESDQVLIRRFLARKGITPTNRTRRSSLGIKNRSSINYDNIKWIVGHPTLPDGWKIRQRYDNDFRTAFLSPCGLIFLSRRRVLEFMEKEQSYSDADFSKVKSGSKIFRDSIEHPGLPVGWRCRLSTKSNLISFISPKAKRILTNANVKSSKAYKELSDENKMKIDSFFTANKMTLKQRINSNGQKKSFRRYYIRRWARSDAPEEPDKVLPEGWMRKAISGLKYYKAPTGQVFMSRKNAFKFIENGVDILSDVKIEDEPKTESQRTRQKRMRSKRKRDGNTDKTLWVDATPEMPEGWTKRVRYGKNGRANQLNYKTPNGTIFPSKISAMEHLKSLNQLANGDYSIKEEFQEDMIIDENTYEEMNAFGGDIVEVNDETMESAESEDVKPRIKISAQDLKCLIPAYKLNPNPNMEVLDTLSRETGLPIITILSWFESRRKFLMDISN